MPASRSVAWKENQKKKKFTSLKGFPEHSASVVFHPCQTVHDLSRAIYTCHFNDKKSQNIGRSFLNIHMCVFVCV